MWLDPLWSFLEQEVFPAPSVVEGKKPFFNLYNDADPRYDLPGAAAIRRDNLRSYLESLPERPPFFLLGEAPGWHGCRFSGVPFTSEMQLAKGSLPFQGRISSHAGAPHAETSATIFWEALRPRHPHFFVWSSLPFHPYQPGNPLSYRTPTRQEMRLCLPIVRQIIQIFAPENVLAVGRVAEQVLSWLEVPFQPVRHPAHGGAAQFKTGISEVFAGRDGIPTHAKTRAKQV